MLMVLQMHTMAPARATIVFLAVEEGLMSGVKLANEKCVNVSMLSLLLLLLLPLLQLYATLVKCPFLCIFI